MRGAGSRTGRGEAAGAGEPFPGNAGGTGEPFPGNAGGTGEPFPGNAECSARRCCRCCCCRWSSARWEHSQQGFSGLASPECERSLDASSIGGDIPISWRVAASGVQVLDVGNMNDWQRKSPLDWEMYVNKLVKVVAVEKNEYEGWVLTVDPVSATIVLATFPENEKGSISFVMGHAVQEVEILQEGNSDMKQRLARILEPEESQAYSPEELEKRKNALKTWLETNHIPVGEQGELGRTLSVAGVLTIEPPYGPEQCSSANEIILARVQGLLQGWLQRCRAACSSSAEPAAEASL